MFDWNWCLFFQVLRFLFYLAQYVPIYMHIAQADELTIHWATTHCCYWVVWVINALFGETWIPTLNWIPSF